MVDHRSRLESFRYFDSQRAQFLEELLAELTKTQDELKQVKLDLVSETEARRKWQEELKELKGLGNEKYAVVLIDGDSDGYIFKDCLREGIDNPGEKAADNLHQDVQSYLGNLSEDYNDLKIVVKVYANVDGLAHALLKGHTIEGVAEVRSFVTGFTNRLPLCDFIDVGYGKERADNKIKEALKFHLDTGQCKHALVGCHYDAGYVPFLGQFVADKRYSSRMTLIEGSLPLGRLKDAGFRTARLPRAFEAEQRQANQSPQKSSNSHKNHDAKPERLGLILRDDSGKRLDRPLRVRTEVIKQFEKANLCHWLFLRGECGKRCPRNHAYRPLTDEELDALWLLSRRSRCNKVRREGGDCDNDKCIYGHS